MKFPHFWNRNILFFNLPIDSIDSLKTGPILKFSYFFFFFSVVLGGQPETPAPISVPATPQLDAVIVRGRFQRHDEVPEKRGLDKLTALLEPRRIG